MSSLAMSLVVSLVGVVVATIVVTSMVSLVVVSAVSVISSLTMVIVVVVVITPSSIVEIGITPGSSLLVVSVSLFHVLEILLLGLVHKLFWQSQVFYMDSFDITLRDFQKFVSVGR